MIIYIYFYYICIFFQEIDKRFFVIKNEKKRLSTPIDSLLRQPEFR